MIFVSLELPDDASEERPEGQSLGGSLQNGADCSQPSPGNRW